jgi:hypothetical protein
MDMYNMKSPSFHNVSMLIQSLNDPVTRSEHTMDTVESWYLGQLGNHQSQINTAYYMIHFNINHLSLTRST